MDSSHSETFSAPTHSPFQADFLVNDAHDQATNGKVSMVAGVGSITMDAKVVTPFVHPQNIAQAVNAFRAVHVFFNVAVFLAIAVWFPTNAHYLVAVEIIRASMVKNGNEVCNCVSVHYRVVPLELHWLAHYRGMAEIVVLDFYAPPFNTYAIPSSFTKLPS